jgi:hypothetical protein
MPLPAVVVPVERIELPTFGLSKLMAAFQISVILQVVAH